MAESAWSSLKGELVNHYRFATRAEARRAVWAAGADPSFTVIDLDATLVGSHSEREGAAPTYKKGFGFHPLLAYLDATGEAVAGFLRSGNAGSQHSNRSRHLEEREHAQVIEITNQVDLSGWPPVNHMIARREPAHPGAQLTFSDTTDTTVRSISPTWPIATLRISKRSTVAVPELSIASVMPKTPERRTGPRRRFRSPNRGSPWYWPHKTCCAGPNY